MSNIKRQNQYLNLSYEEIRDYIINSFIEKYFPDTFNDFSNDNDNIAKMLLETSVAIGDILTFYINENYYESSLDTAQQEENIWNLSKAYGYTPRISKGSSANPYIYFLVPQSNSDQNGISASYAPTLKAGSAVMATNGTVFESVYDINLSGAAGTIDQTIGKRDGGGNITHYSLRAKGLFLAGKTVSQTFTITSFEKFKKIALPDTNVIEVLDVYDAHGNKYYKVDDLAQDVVYERVTNTSSDSSDVPYVLNIKKVPYRFVIDVDPTENITYIQFGSGNSTYLSSSTLIPDPSLYALRFSDDSATMPVPAINPEYFTGSLSLGIVPDTNIIVRYRIGGGIISNVGSNEIRDSYDINVEFPTTNLVNSTKNDVINSFAVNNTEQASGGGDKDEKDLVRYLGKMALSSQRRVVTPEDFIARTLGMPPAFGSCARVAVEPISDSNTVKLYILSQDSNGKFSSPTNTLFNNIRDWVGLARLSATGIELEAGEIINLKINFSVVCEKKINANKILYACIIALRDMFDNSKMQMAQPIVISDVSDVLGSVDGVYGVDKVEFIENFSTNYPSKSRFRVKKYTKNNIITCPAYSVFEVRNYTTDIIGNSL